MLNAVKHLIKRHLGLLRWLGTLSANNVGILDILVFLVILAIVKQKIASVKPRLSNIVIIRILHCLEYVGKVSRHECSTYLSRTTKDVQNQDRNQSEGMNRNGGYRDTTTYPSLGYSSPQRVREACRNRQLRPEWTFTTDIWYARHTKERHAFYGAWRSFVF